MVRESVSYPINLKLFWVEVAVNAELWRTKIAETACWLIPSAETNHEKPECPRPQ